MDIENYLTGEEKRQMESLMEKAAERRRQSRGREGDGEAPGMYFQFRIGIGKKPEENAGQGAEDDGELRLLLRQLYKYCKKHGYDEPQEIQTWLQETDEELPY